ncbi:MAG: DedA family protein [Deinococcus sp.]|nr:DedA family protein [Deinococcus sp.]
MELVASLVDLLLHLDEHLTAVVQNYSAWTYIILFLIIFCETGLVVTPILPGDSLLFAAGAVAAGGALEVGWLFGMLCVAAVAGDTVNYWIGHLVGPQVFQKGRVRFLKQEYLDYTHRFFETYGGMTIVVARFVPIVRTLAPFLAGVGSMTYWRFVSYNIFGGIAWIAIFVFGGYFFGNLPLVKENFSLVILALVVISVLPSAIAFFRRRHQPS